MVTEVFGDILVSDASECLETFPSPESLKGRVIISTKPPKEYLETKGSIKEDGCSMKLDKVPENSVWGKEIPELVVKLDKDDGLGLDQCQEDDDHQDDSQILQPNVPPEYKHLIGIRAQKMKGGIKAWLKVCAQSAHRVSLNEEKLEKAVITHGKDIVKY